MKIQEWKRKESIAKMDRSQWKSNMKRQQRRKVRGEERNQKRKLRQSLEGFFLSERWGKHQGMDSRRE
jgi:hypothetical protein